MQGNGDCNMESIEIFRQLRDACDEVVTAYESKNENAIEVALGKFMFLMLKLDCLK